MKSKVALLLLTVLLSLLLGEGAARLVLRSSPDSGFQDPAGFYQHHLNLTKWEGGNWLRDLTPHPFFGYVMTQDGTGANNHGFKDSQPFPYRKNSRDDFVISVLGGSVALGWAGWIQNQGKEYFVSELKKMVPALAGRNIVILDMSMGGYKQPQQLYIASFFLDSVDLFINLEGHNELNAFANQPVFPIEFPIGAYLYFWQSRQAVEASRELKFLSSLNHLLISAGSKSALFQSSALYFALTKGVFHFVTNRSTRVAEEAKAALEKELAAPGKTFYDAESVKRDRFEAAVSAWERFVQQEQRLVSASGGKVVFFLQPNQYMPGSKQFSEWEQKNVLTLDYLRKAKLYELLPKAVARMRGRGINIHDLTMIYSKEKETVYADSCCHVNELGNRIMASAIIAKIALMKLR